MEPLNEQDVQLRVGMLVLNLWQMEKALLAAETKLAAQKAEQEPSK